MFVRRQLLCEEFEFNRRSEVEHSPASGASPMEPSTPNINDISAIIRQKERELHDIHERRCLQLEKVNCPAIGDLEMIHFTSLQAIEEREKSHIDISKKFSQLRDDFKYNLSLLEARDSEIRRLEAVSNTLNGHVQTLQAEKSGLMHRLDNLQSREQERKDRAKGDAVLQKVLLSLLSFIFLM